MAGTPRWAPQNHRSTQSGLKRCSPRAAASAPATHTTAWTHNEALDALRAHHRRHGQAPLYQQWAAADPTGARPSTPTVLALCGSWNEALRQAGLAIRHDQPGRRTGRGARRAAVQRYLDGESSTAIAVDLGCHPATVLKWVRATGGKTRPHGRPSGTAGT